MNYTGMYYPDT